MLRLAAAAFAFMLLAPVAQAQNADIPTFEERAPEITEAQRAAARRLLDVTDTEKGAMVGYTHIIDLLMASEQGLTAEQRAAMRAILIEEMEAALPDFMDIMAHTYARHLSAEDMNTISDFYETPAGRNYVAALPALTTEGMEVGSAWAQQVLGPRIIARMAALRDNPPDAP